MMTLNNVPPSPSKHTKIYEDTTIKYGIEFRRVLSSIATSIITLFSLYALFPGTSANVSIRYLILVMDSLLHVSMWPVVVTTSGFAFFLANQVDERRKYCRMESLSCKGPRCKCSHCLAGYCPSRRIALWTLGLVSAFTCLTTAHALLQIVTPSWILNPFLWGTYKIYEPNEIKEAMKGICLDYQITDEGPPLCLSQSNWHTLSSGSLFNTESEDLSAILKGINYAKNDSKGVIINVLARDTVHAIKALRQNVEGLVPFFSKLSVVVFENDSVDGTRDAFRRWGAKAEGYDIDLMECEEATDCKFGESHRYDSVESHEYFTSSAVGNMAKYRQRMSDYVNKSEKYVDYSHMIVVDLDLAVSLSPLGVIHSIGLMPDRAIVSSGRQVWPGSLGTLVPPYDFSAYQFHETSATKHLIALHHRFCELMPEGDRWRNQCDAVSPMQLLLILYHDIINTEPYQVASAYNGAVIYPLDLVQKTNAKYDTGHDGQRCEHIGYNLAFKDSIYVNPKWNMHVDPTNPGGPTGKRALKNVVRIALNPHLGLPIFMFTFFPMMIPVYLTMMLVLYFAYPFWVKIIKGTRFKEVLLPIYGKRLERENEFDFLTDSPRKRKYSDAYGECVKDI